MTEQDEQTLRKLRHELRGVNDTLKKDRDFKVFSQNVDLNVYPDYPEKVKNPLTLIDTFLKINNMKYNSPEEYISDLALIRENALKFNGITGAVYQKVLDHLSLC